MRIILKSKTIPPAYVSGWGERAHLVRHVWEAKRFTLGELLEINDNLSKYEMIIFLGGERRKNEQGDAGTSQRAA